MQPWRCGVRRWKRSQPPGLYLVDPCRPGLEHRSIPAFFKNPTSLHTCLGPLLGPRRAEIADEAATDNNLSGLAYFCGYQLELFSFTLQPLR
jgi:hypothetical protein